jgi:protein-serine/threonine kinase
LLKRARSRWPLDKVASNPWVEGSIRVDGGIRFREEKQGEEVL